MKRSILLTALIHVFCGASVFAQLSSKVMMRVRLKGTQDITGCGVNGFNLRIGTQAHFQWANGTTSPSYPSAMSYTPNQYYPNPEPSCDREGRPLVLNPFANVFDPSGAEVALDYIPSHITISIEENSNRLVTIARNYAMVDFRGGEATETHEALIKRNSNIPGSDFFNAEGYKFEISMRIPKLNTINLYRDPSRTQVTTSVCAGDMIYGACEYSNNENVLRRQRIEWEVTYSDQQGGALPNVYESYGQSMSFQTFANRSNPAASVEVLVRARLMAGMPPSSIQADNYTNNTPGYYRGPWSDYQRVTVYPKAPQINFAGIDSLAALTQQSELTNTNADASLTVSHVPCFGGNDGKVTISKIPDGKSYLIVWKKKGGAPQSTTISSTNLPYEITGLSAGKYAFVIQLFDSQAPLGCFSTQYFSIKQPPTALSFASSSKQDVTCADKQDGSISVEPAGGLPPYTITLQGFVGQTRVVNRNNPERVGKDYVFKNLAGNANDQVINYRITLGNGTCGTIEKAFTLTAPPPLAINISGNNITCFGATTSAETSISGGSGSYTLWLYDSAGTRIIQKIEGVTSGDKPILPGLAAAAYMVRAEDAKGCGGTQRFKLIQPSRLAVTSQLTPSVCGKANGSVTLQATGGVPAADGSGYTFALQHDNQTAPKKGTNVVFADLNSGSYAVTITDANNCETQATYDIVGDAAPVIVDLGSEEFFCSGQTVKLDAGNPGATYQWTSSTGATSTDRIFDATTSGTFTVTVTNPLGCQGQGSRKLTFGSDILKADFIISSEGTTQDTVVLINVSFPLPDSAYWTFPAGVQVIDASDFVQYLIFADTGTYTLTLSTTKGACFDQISDTITILPGDEEDEVPGGRQASSLISDFVIHPNPSDGKFTISIQLREAADVYVGIFSTTGSTPWASYQGSGKQNYEISDTVSVPAGVYYVVLKAGNEKKVTRIVIY